MIVSSVCSLMAGSDRFRTQTKNSLPRWIQQRFPLFPILASGANRVSLSRLATLFGTVVSLMRSGLTFGYLDCQFSGTVSRRFLGTLLMLHTFSVTWWSGEITGMSKRSLSLLTCCVRINWKAKSGSCGADVCDMSVDSLRRSGMDLNAARFLFSEVLNILVYIIKSIGCRTLRVPIC